MYCEHGNELSCSIKCWEVLEWLHKVASRVVHSSVELVEEQMNWLYTHVKSQRRMRTKDDCAESYTNKWLENSDNNESKHNFLQV
jgi:hypothetical protein